MLLRVGLLAGVVSAFCAAPAVTFAAIQQPAPAAASPAAARLIGTVTAAGTDSLTIKLESGGEAVISIGPTTRLLRTAPGEKTLKGATVIQLGDLATGDRVLVLRPAPGADATHYTAAAVVAMKQTDIAQAHASEAEDWQKRGVGGIVKTIEPAPSGAGAESAVGGATGSAATIIVGTAQPGRTLSIHVTPATAIRRYADDSVKYADSKAATLAEIHPGDQLRARGDHSADSAEVTAVEIVAGSFRNVAGTITAINAAQNTLTVTDLATKKPVTLRLTADTQMRKLPLEMAQRLAARTGQSHAGEPGDQTAAARSPSAPGMPPAPSSAESRPPGAAGPDQMRRASGDPAAMLQHSPLVTLAELKKGDAIMVVAARGGGGASDAATAITLIAGVEPLLESPTGGASQSLFSASWNLSGGGAEAAAQ